MQPNFTDVKAALITFIESQSTVLQINPQWIYNYEVTKPQGYPYISVTPIRRTAKFADTQRNRTDFYFKIRCAQERQTVGTQAKLTPQSESERILTTLADTLLAMFDNFPNYNLNNQITNLVFVQPASAEWGYAKAPDTDLRIVDITVNPVVVQ